MFICNQGSGGWKGKLGEHLFEGINATGFTKQQNSDVVDGKLKKDAPMEQSYNLKDDPWQRINVVQENQKLSKEMCEILEDYGFQIN